MKPIQYKISEIYTELSGNKAKAVVQLPASASDRTYFRITNSDNSTLIAAHNLNIRENLSFINLSKHFQKYNLNVPEVFYFNKEQTIYFQEDLGDLSLFSKIQQGDRNSQTYEDELFSFYKKALEQLADIQIDAAYDLDFKNCYPVEEFDETSMLWDLNYFKYYFLKISEIHFEEDLLEKEFKTLINYLLGRNSKYFMFRDFQSRNIMIKDNETYLIDFQGGRKGPLSYDIASCTLDAKANLSFEFRERIIEYYFELISKKITISKEEFENELSATYLIRIMQAFGAYGFRGLWQKKQLFIQSIPLAARNLQHLIKTRNFDFNIDYLLSILSQIAEKYVEKEAEKISDKLSIRVNSFSYKKGIPEDTTENGGGFVFDCRALPNPGRIPEMQLKTAFDDEVSSMLEKSQEVKAFINNTFEIVSPSIENYLQRGFKNLMISFGCTGGQHRSVYCANAISKLIEEKYNIEIKLNHRELS